MQRISLFGSTGSIGKSTIEVIKHMKNDFSIFALAANTDFSALARQIIDFKPKIVVIGANQNKDLLYKLVKSKIKQLTILTGEAGLINIAENKSTDILVMAMSGTMGFIPLLKAIEKRKKIALSTKELLVGFGKIIMAQAKKYKTEILPIDSELVGVHQCLDGKPLHQIKKVILTASGGPFFRRKNLNNISINEALKHPVWKMGKKITIDSATLANKGLEVIETSRMFSIPIEKIDVLIHPQSIVHAMVEFNDNTIIASLSRPDMRSCIQYALTYPHRLPSIIHPLNLAEQNKLEFFRPDLEKFKALKFAYQAAKLDGTAPCIFNAANEQAVNNFIKGKIKFNMIPVIIEKVMSILPYVKNPDLRALIQCEQTTMKFTEAII
jgi:1-deoxy-D-xylulose-5-phosphate reductoisomerase